MNPFTERYLTAFAATAVLALGLYGCGGGGGDGPMMPAPEPMPEDVDLSDVTAGFMAMAGMFTVTAGQSQNHGDIAFSCAVGGADCSVTVEVATDGTVSATSTGGMVTAMNSDAYTARITPMAVDLAPVTAGFVAGAGTVTIKAGQSVDHGDVALSCAAGAYDCTVTVEVATDGTVSATSTGGMVTAMNSDAYNVRLTPVAVDLASVTAGFMAGAGTVAIMAGQSVDHGDIAFNCAAGGADCQVMVMVDANGAITATSTGGTVTAINSTAYDDRIATMHPVVGKWAGDWPGGARTVLTITSVSSDGQVTGTYRHQERGGQPFILEISPSGPVTATLQNDVLSFSYGQSTFEFTKTAEDTFGFTFQFSPDVQMVSIDVDRQDPDLMPTDVPSAEALANVIDLVANDSRQDLFGNYVSGHWWRSHGIGAQQAVVTGTYRGGQWANPIVSHDDDGQLQHNVAVIQQNALQQADPWARSGRYINTYEAPENLEGVTRSTSRLSDHELESEGWQVTELNADYDNAGNLSILVATDVQPEDGSKGPYEGFTTEADKNIELPGAPALPSDQDFLVVWIPNGDTIEGSLAGIAGTFSCANADGCVFVDDRTPGDYYARDAGITFTPNGGTAQPVTPSTPKTVPNADYLAMGHWLYVPEDVTDSVNYEFGVFASGGDPFEVAYLAPLVGTATYLGDALGMYYVDGLSDDPTIGSFTADVTLEADFGDGSETGFIDGEVYNFEYEDDVASSLPATVNLTSDPYSYLSTNFGVAEDSTNIFDTTWSGDPAPYPGGHIAAEATASADGHNWYGEWHAAFYGNGLATTDIPPSYVEHPTSVAGTFNVSTYERQPAGRQRSRRLLRRASV